ncbi:MAG: hypothetical protein N2255_09300, partial [Kiritimatiellae bacterium]|nr:hypothetical protein [Kiritimatiellia bacterium]
EALGDRTMKIPLGVQQTQTTSVAAENKILERDVLAAQKGDWEARRAVVRTFMPLLTSLAQKRAKDTATINAYIEKGKEGLLAAVAKYKPGIGPERFRIFALDHIERAMDRKKEGSFWTRLFRRN